MRSLQALSGCSAVIVLLTLLAPAFAGVVIHVPADQPTIAAGLGVAASGDTVLVACDTYYESGLALPSGVTLKSAAYDSGCVVIDGSGTRASILTCLGTTDATVQGITFTNGSAPGGGAVNCNPASVLFDYCFFTNNHATTSGGAIYWGGGTPELVGCTFTGNTADGAGGGLVLYGTGGTVMGCDFVSNEAPWGAGVMAEQLNTTTAFTECEFTDNTATNISRGGGGVWTGSQAAPTFFQCRFEQNDGSYGGAVCNWTEASPTFMSCEFDGNTGYYGGGAVFGHDDHAVFDGCEFTFNEPSNGPGGASGGELSDASFSYCSFYMNEAQYGGAISCENQSALTVESSTIVENVSNIGDGAGICVWDDSSVSIDQTIIAFNRSGQAVYCELGSSATVTCSDVSDNDGGDWVGCLAGQEGAGGNLHVNPLICEVPINFLYLCADSPCLPENNDCGERIGAYDEGCPACESPVEGQSWGAVKALYR